MTDQPQIGMKVKAGDKTGYINGWHPGEDRPWGVAPVMETPANLERMTWHTREEMKEIK